MLEYPPVRRANPRHRTSPPIALRLTALFRVGEADFARVAECGPGDQVGFSNTGEIASCASESARPAHDMRWVADDGESSLREGKSGSDGFIEVDIVPGFRDPVMLDVEYDGTTRAGLRRS